MSGQTPILTAGRFLVLLLIALTAIAQPPTTAERRPWQWSIEERLAARCDRDAARLRVERARAGKRAAIVQRDGNAAWHGITDHIEGREWPHLLLPTEIFESVVYNAFFQDGWQEAYAAHAAAAGLPPTFWQELAAVSVRYVADLREWAQLGANRDAQARRGIHARLCVTRAEALNGARAIFGPSLDVFMYTSVAPTITITTDHVEDAKALKSREQGCR